MGDGIQKAKEKGVKFGRQKSLNKEQIKELQNRRKNGQLIKDLMKDYGLSKASVYRYLAATATPQVEAEEYFQRDIEAEDRAERKKSVQRYIRLLIQDGHSFATAAEKLNDQAYPTVDGKPLWTWQAIKKYSK